MLASFLNSMLHLHPDHRASATHMLNHPLISSITVQGEIDQMVRAEEEARKRSAEGLMSPSEEPSGAATPMEVQPEPVEAASKTEGTGGGGKKKKGKKNKRVNAALANADAEAVLQAEHTVAQRAMDDANAMKPVDDLEEESPSAAPVSRSQVNVTRERTTSAQRSGST